MRNYIQPGENITVPAPYDVASGAGCLVGDLFGIASGAALSGETVVIVTTGCFDMAKTVTDAVTVGASIFWNDTTKLATVTDTGVPIGHAIAVAGNPSSTVRVRLSV